MSAVNWNLPPMVKPGRNTTPNTDLKRVVVTRIGRVCLVPRDADHAERQRMVDTWIASKIQVGVRS